MYELKRIYLEAKERYIENVGWVERYPNKGEKVAMYSIEYIDIDSDGKVHNKGAEDFSIERFRRLKFGVAELKNKVLKDNPTLKTTYKHDLIKKVYFRSVDKTASKYFRKYLENKYINVLQFNEILFRFH